MNTPASEFSQKYDFDFSNVTEVLVDSRFALDKAFEQGLPHDVLIRTSSPALCSQSGINVEYLEKGIGPEKFQIFRDAIEVAALGVYETLCQEQALKKYALVAARTVFMTINSIGKAISLTGDNYGGNLAVVLIKSGNTAFDQRRSPPWKNILGDKAVFVTVPINEKEIEYNFDQDRNHPNFFGRLLCTGWPRLGHRIFEKIWKYLPLSLARGVVLVLRENPLLRETAYHLALKGYAIRLLPENSSNLSPIEGDLVHRVHSVLRAEISTYLSAVLPENGIENVTEYLLTRIVEEIDKFESSRLHWNKVLDHYGKFGSCIAMTNAPHRPTDLALLHVCRNFGIPLASFQHGVAKEIDKNHLGLTAALSESTASDVFFGFNDRRVELDEKLAYESGESVSAGLPIEFWRSGSYRKRNPDVAPVLFASTQAYGENIGATALKGVADKIIAESEISLIGNVLTRISHPVLYKPYPEHQYLDADPVYQFALEAPNITVHTEGKDLAYLLPDARVVVLARATSTLSWCLASGKPLVYINYQSQNPLYDDVHKALAAGIFLFDDTSKTFEDELSAFLSLPLEEIDRVWNEKRSARQHAIERYFGSRGPGAGKRAANFLTSNGYL
jgi:hypothetical protein